MTNKITKIYKLGRNIAKYRKARGLSQNKLAEILDISREHLGNIEIGRKTPTIGLLCKIAIALDVQEKDLFEFEMQ